MDFALLIRDLQDVCDGHVNGYISLAWLRLLRRTVSASGPTLFVRKLIILVQTAPFHILIALDCTINQISFETRILSECSRTLVSRWSTVETRANRSASSRVRRPKNCPPLRPRANREVEDYTRLYTSRKVLRSIIDKVGIADLESGYGLLSAPASSSSINGFFPLPNSVRP